MMLRRSLTIIVLTILVVTMSTAQIKNQLQDAGAAIDMGSSVEVNSSGQIETCGDNDSLFAGVVVAVQNVGGTDYYLISSSDIYPAKLDAGVTAGDRLTTSAGGSFKTASTGEIIVGIALEDGHATDLRKAIFEIDRVQNAFDTLKTPGDATDTLVAHSQFKVYGELIADSIQAVGGVIELDDSVAVHGSVAIDDTLSVTNNTVIGGNLYVDGTINGDVSLTSVQTYTDTIRSTNDALPDTIWFMGQVYINGELIADSIQAMGGVIELDDSVAVHGSMTIDDTLSVVDNVHVGGNLYVDTLKTPGDATDTLVAHSQFKVYGELIADSIQAIGGVIELDDSVAVHGAMTIDDSLYVDNALHTGGTVYLGDSLFFGSVELDTSDVDSILVLNGDGKVGWAPLNYIGGAMTRAYGELYIDTSRTYSNVPASGSWQYMDSCDIGHTAGLPFVYANCNDGYADSLIIGPEGANLYQMNISLSFQGDSKLWLTMGLFVNDVLQPKFTMFSDVASAGEMKSSSLSGLITLTEDDIVTVKFYNRFGAGKEMIIQNFNLQITRVDD